MITYIANKCPSDPFPCLFECLFYAILDDCMLSFDVIMINDELFPIVFSHHCFIRFKKVLFLA